MADGKEPGDPGRKKAGKPGTRGDGGTDPGPLEDHAIRIHRQVWKDAAKLAIDDDVSTSALIATWIRAGLARRGIRYLGEARAGAGEGPPAQAAPAAGGP